MCCIAGVLLYLPEYAVVSIWVCCCTSLGVLLHPPGCAAVPTWVCCCTYPGMLLYLPGCATVATWVWCCTSLDGLYPPRSAVPVSEGGDLAVSQPAPVSHVVRLEIAGQSNSTWGQISCAAINSDRKGEKRVKRVSKPQVLLAELSTFELSQQALFRSGASWHGLQTWWFKTIFTFFRNGEAILVSCRRD
jgi:hypothetical protein